MIFYDSETVGKVGPVVLMQYAVDDGPIILHEVFHERIARTLDLIEYLVTQPITCYNLIFDWFHLVKLYNILRVFKDNGYDDVPTVASFAEVEATNPSTYCLRPPACLDLMLHVRKGPFQYTMNRKPILLRRVPTQIANELADELKRRIKLPSICFAKRPYEWHVNVREDNPAFSDIKLTFASSSSLSAICHAVLGEDKTDFPIPKHLMPTELSWLPYGQYGKKPWARVIGSHIGMWHSDEKARYYANRDIDLLRRLHQGLGCPEAGDVDSELAAALGAARWRGFSLDHSRLGLLKENYIVASKAHPRGVRQAKEYIGACLSQTERAAFKSTSKVVLELIASGENERAAERAAGVLAARKARLRLTLVEKLLKLPSYHPDFRVIGAKSNRMSGGSEDKSKGGSINPQGIPREEDFRSCFTLAYPGETLEGGDAVSYEVMIMCAVTKCKTLHEELSQGKNFHGLMGELWHGVTYEEVMATKKDATGLYLQAKVADLAWMYLAQDAKLASGLGKTEEEVKETTEALKLRFPEIITHRLDTAKSFCSMRQVGGLGSAIEWHEPKDYIESIFGFRRYFTLENGICRELYKLAERPPAFVNAAKDKIVRREERGTQTVGGATRSSIFATAFGIQQANMRAACNHEIQSPGGHITKMFQLAFWNEQPAGVHPFRCRAMNIHDELLVVHDGTVDCEAVRSTFLQTYRKHVPLLDWTWEVMPHWKK